MTVQELKTLLSATQPGSAFTLSGTALGVDAVKQLFDRTLPSQTLTVNAAQPDAANLSVSGAITVGNAVDAPVVVTFATDAAKINVAGLLIDATEPGFSIDTPFLKLTLDFLSAFHFEKLHLLLSAQPDADGNTAALTGIGSSFTFDASGGPHTLTFKGFTNPAIPDADITFEGDFENVSLADPAVLGKLIPGVDFNIPSTIPLADSIDLSKIILTVSPSLGSLTMAYIEVRSAKPWKIIPGRFEFASLAVGFGVSLPTIGPKLTAIVRAVLNIDSIHVAAAVTVPGLALTAELQDRVPLAPFIRQYLPGVTIDSFDISQFEIALDILQQHYYGAIDIVGNWTLTSGVELKELYLTISGQGTEATGKIAATFNLGGTDVLISAAYTGPSEGWTFTGSTVGSSKIPIGHLLSGAAEQFGVTLPGPVSELALDRILLSLTTGSSTGANRSFFFTCQGTTVISDVEVAFTPTIKLAYNKDSEHWDGHYGGTLVLKSPPTGEDSKELKFSVNFNDTADSQSLTATYEGAALGFNDFASAVNFKGLPPIPSNLDVGLTSAGFAYDFKHNSLVLGAGSSTYDSNAVFVTFLPEGTDAARQYFFLLGINKTFSLSDLPLVGKELAAIQDIQVADLVLVIGSEPADTGVATKVNGLVKGVFPKGYPVLAETTGTFVLTGKITFGADVQPLNVSFGGQKSSTTLVPVALSAGGDGTTWFNVQKSFGPVSIGRIGVMYQSGQQVLWFEIDATLAVGPLTLDLVGLGLGSPLSSFKPQFSIKGLGVAYSNPPLKIAGSLVNLAPAGSDQIEFEGGVTIGTDKLMLTAFGYYGEQNHGQADAFTSMFIFGDLAYNFGGPPAFFVTGLALGFGYNSSLRIPGINEIAEFPFVQVLPTSTAPNTDLFGANPTPQKVLDVIMHPKKGDAWVAPQQGALWFGAGITFTSFSLVNSQALILVTLGADGVIIALIGTSRAQFPQPVGSGKTPVYAYIQLDLKVEIAPTLGFFSVEAVLAKSSFLLDKACVLTGGFAFFVWFGSNPHAGDFVLTLGGYNPGFRPPSYYPQVPAVGFHWSLDSSITISGGAYFAFTPSALMVGGELSATYQSGNLKAWFNVHADIIVQWKPFWFDAGFGITIGASYKFNLLFTTFTVSVELGVNLEFWGPPTGGIVGVNWYIISFSIPFGASKNASKPVLNQWSDVQAMLPNSGTADKPNVLTLTPSSGLSTSTTSPANQSKRAAAGDAPEPWVVRGSQFGFTTSSSIPASTASIGGAHRFNGSQFNVAPLGWKGVMAAHTVTIVDGANNDWSRAFAAIPAQSNVPSQLWGVQQTSTPDAAHQLLPNQLTGTSLQVSPPAIGGSAGPVNVEVNLASVNLGIAGALLGVSGSAPPSGDIAVNSSKTITTIADPNSGIGSQPATTARGAIYAALKDLHCAPPANDPMTKFAQNAGCALSAQPLLVS